MSVLSYEAECGEHIEETIEGALLISSRKKSDVEFSFNGITLCVNANRDDQESVLSLWHQKIDERRKEYLESEEFKETEKERKIKLGNKQAKMNVLISQFPTNNSYKIITWLKDFATLADFSGVSYDKEYVLDKLDSYGFKNNEYVGFKGEWDSNKLVRYTVGQVINCIETFGTPHPITTKFCDDILARDDFKSEEVIF